VCPFLSKGPRVFAKGVSNMESRRERDSGRLGSVKLHIIGKDPMFQNITMPMERADVLQISLLFHYG